MQPAVVVLFVGLAVLKATGLHVIIPKECEVPESEPRCKANLPAWVYNKTSKYCEKLSNGDCYTEGKFKTENECNTKCRDPVLGICALGVEDGQCRRIDRRYSFSATMRRCVLREGCIAGNSGKNDFATLSKCNKVCGGFTQDPCLEAHDEHMRCNSTSAASPWENIWFRYNQKEQTCEPFNYTGCGESRNRFWEERDCWRFCAKHIKEPCKMPISEGYYCVSRPPTLVYGYNHKTGKCESFLHKGCGGNDNYFIKRTKCWKTCAKFSRSRCTKDPGLNFLGWGIFKKFYYDRTWDRCFSTRHFRTSTHAKNRFDSEKECEQECKVELNTPIHPLLAVYQYPYRVHYAGKRNWMER